MSTCSGSKTATGRHSISPATGCTPAARRGMGTRKPREGIVVRGTEKKYEDTGRLDHIAFAATDVDGVRKRLQVQGVKFRESIVPRTGDTQFFLYDPDGVGVELNFPKS